MSGTIGDARKRLGQSAAVASGQVRTGDGNQSASSSDTTAPVATTQTDVDEVRELIRAACEKAWNQGHIAAVHLNQTMLGQSYSDPGGNPYRPTPSDGRRQ